MSVENDVSFALPNRWNRAKKGFFLNSCKILKRKIRYMEDKKENDEERKKPEEEDIKQSRVIEYPRNEFKKRGKSISR